MKALLLPLLLLVVGCLSSGCNTPNEDFSTSSEEVTYAAVVVPMTIVAAPVALVEWTGWKIATSGPKPKVYASGGVSMSEFQKAIENVEGGNCIPDLKVGPDKIFLFEYHGKKANYYGRFKDNRAIEYK
jgi:hypothetical protein